MMRILSLVLVATLLVGCGGSQSALNNADRICRDGVEYLVYRKMNTAGHLSWSVVPHYKNGKGELFTCRDVAKG